MSYLSWLPLAHLIRTAKGLLWVTAMCYYPVSQEVRLGPSGGPGFFHVLSLLAGGREGLPSPEDNSLVVTLSHDSGGGMGIWQRQRPELLAQAKDNPVPCILTK